MRMTRTTMLEVLTSVPAFFGFTTGGADPQIVAADSEQRGVTTRAR